MSIPSTSNLEITHDNSKPRYYFANRPLDAAGESADEIQSDIDEAIAAGYPIPKNPSHSVAETMETFNLQKYPSPIPDASDYISARIRHSDDKFPGFNYGQFVEVNDKVAFAKFRYGPKNTEKQNIDGNLVDVRVGGLQREASVLKSLREHNYEAPAVLGYSPAFPEGAEPYEAETLETLYIEAISPEEGTTLPPEMWTSNLAKMAAQKIKTFAHPAGEIELFKDESIQLPVEVLLMRARIADGDTYHDVLTDTLANYQHLDQPIVVHGDTWLNNIIVKHDESDAMFIDWELAGAGYRGQDAGRTLWGLTLDGDWQFAEISDSAKAFVSEWANTNNSEEEKNNLKFGVLLESLRWIADRTDKLDFYTFDNPEAEKLLLEIDAVKQHCLKITEAISDAQS